MLIGLVLLIRPRGVSNVDLATLRTLLLAAAVFMSWSSPPELAVAGINTATVGLAAAWMAFAYVNVPRFLPIFAAAGVAFAGWRAAGPSWSQVAEFARNLVPQTRSGWGVVGVAAAFVMLAAGAVVSLRPPPKPRETD